MTTEGTEGNVIKQRKEMEQDSGINTNSLYMMCWLEFIWWIIYRRQHPAWEGKDDILLFRGIKLVFLIIPDILSFILWASLEDRSK